MPGYDAQHVGDAVEISTTPEKVPTPWLLIAIPGGLLILIALAESFVWGVIAAGFCYGAMYLLMHSKQATQYRAPAKFRVSKTGIDVAGNNIPKDAIHRIIVRNHVLKNTVNMQFSPPTWYSGKMTTITSSCRTQPTTSSWRMLVTRFACVSRTPLGFPVVPLE